MNRGAVLLQNIFMYIKDNTLAVSSPYAWFISQPTVVLLLFLSMWFEIFLYVFVLIAFRIEMIIGL
ncbi:hypothetical protein ACJX0J_005535, partial [Zea mays]